MLYIGLMKYLLLGTSKTQAKMYFFLTLKVKHSKYVQPYWEPGKDPEDIPKRSEL